MRYSEILKKVTPSMMSKETFSRNLSILVAEKLVNRTADLNCQPRGVFYELCPPVDKAVVTSQLENEKLNQNITTQSDERLELIRYASDIEKQIYIIREGFLKRFGAYVPYDFTQEHGGTWAKLFTNPANALWNNVEKIGLIKIVDQHEIKNGKSYRNLLKATKKIVGGDFWSGESSGPRLFRDLRIEVKWEAFKKELVKAYSIRPKEIVVDVQPLELEPEWSR